MEGEGETETVAAPEFDPPAGSYPSGTEVSISSTTEGANIYFTTDGSEPSLANGILYTNTISIISPVTIKAIACKSGWLSSDIVSETYFAEYNLRERGPANGYICYIKEDYSDGWRYLEAAPSDQSDGTLWGQKDLDINGYNIDLPPELSIYGAGKQNTDGIVNALKDYNGGIYAAKICDDLVLGGFSDWYLPSGAECIYMCCELHVYGIGDFAPSKPYWSSTEASAGSAYYQVFAVAGTYDQMNKDHTYLYVRAIRRF